MKTKKFLTRALAVLAVLASGAASVGCFIGFCDEPTAPKSML